MEAVEKDEEPDSEPLAIQDTRPNFWFGVPYDLAILFFTAFLVINTQMHSMVDGLIVVPFWIGAAIIVRRDVNGFRVFWARSRIGMYSMFDAHRWGGWSVSPMGLNDQRGSDNDAV